MQLLPGKSLGNFVLGSPLPDCIRLLQLNPRNFKKIRLTFNPDDPLRDDTVVTIETLGINLHFDSASQRLRLIHVYDLSACAIVYEGNFLSLPSESISSAPREHDEKEEKTPVRFAASRGRFVPVDFQVIYNMLGPMYSGSYHEESKLYHVKLGGMTLGFQMEEAMSNEMTLPVSLADGSSPPLARILIFSGADTDHIHLAPLDHRVSYFEPVHVYLNECIEFCWRKKKVYFGSSVEEVLYKVGPPEHVYYKTHEAHAPLRAPPPHVVQPGADPAEMASEIDDMKARDVPPTHRTRGAGDFFFNYTTLGVDIMIDGSTHRVKKFVLHTNPIAHPDFNRWCKSNFRIFVGPRGQPVPSSSNGHASFIHMDSRWRDVEAAFGPPDEPLVYKSSTSVVGRKDVRSSSSHLNSERNAIRVFAYRCVLFEVMTNNHLASVTLFNDPRIPKHSYHRSFEDGRDDTGVDRVESYGEHNSDVFVVPSSGTPRSVLSEMRDESINEREGSNVQSSDYRPVHRSNSKRKKRDYPRISFTSSTSPQSAVSIVADSPRETAEVSKRAQSQRYERYPNDSDFDEVPIES